MTVRQAIALLISFTVNTGLAQNSLLEEILEKYAHTFVLKEEAFRGQGWDVIINEVRQNDNILIGEEHFTNEIPLFVKNISKAQDFDNFYIEVDPYSAGIIKNAITELSETERTAFNEKYKDLFSFYALAPEYDLLKDVVRSGTNILGSDQIAMYADRLIFQELIRETANKKAQLLYREICAKSELHLNRFLENPENPMYLVTPEFSEKIEALQQMTLSNQEHEILKALLKSVAIYTSGPKGHEKRVKLLKHHLMQDYDIWKDQRNLFKYGANHMAKGESLLSVFDIGNLVHNISDANDKKALHIMVIGQKGKVGAPFKKFPPRPVDTGSWPLKSLSPFLNTEEGAWKVYDLRMLRKDLVEQKHSVEDMTLQRVLKGYDLLVVIPEVTAAGF